MLKEQTNYIRLSLAEFILKKRFEKLTARVQSTNENVQSLSVTCRPFAYEHLEGIEEEGARLVCEYMTIVHQIDSYKVNTIGRLGSISQSTLMRQLHLFDELKLKAVQTLELLKSMQKEFNRSWA